MRRLVAIMLAACVAGLALPHRATAQPATPSAAWPTQPLRLVVGFPPGGATDVMARLVAEGLTASLGQNVVVENRSGGGSLVATEAVARTAPDGTTLLFVASSHATLPALYPDLSWDPVRDFSPVALVASTPYILVVNPALPVHTLAELLALAQQQPGKLAFASTGMGTARHLGGEILKRVAQIDILHVPYRGSGAVRADLLAGRIQMMFDNTAVMLPYLRRGELRGLAVTGPKRSPLVPDLPTLREAGLGAADIEGWFALLGPAHLPPAIVQRLNQAVTALLAQPATAEKLAALGAVPLPGSPEDAARLIRAEQTKWGAVIREAGIQPD
ncbi:Bug family tripartite tricarboxylate transporter substrate binding protein [Roseicella frigidaeris]|uniref:Tripartite tricarboxylate transporter substrate binding protein n=1 Tax=Roseicella frigidaeris TaxID=2230885 RepID=A0A327LVB9_9PROT|nr:tripartite tricarboxylate transporter substrate binding protein [Roseicella frigidaeris]RAI54609.1 tripartite tricarboxylate transporter substrate binding protein [Roseicella frigidaeris]